MDFLTIFFAPNYNRLKNEYKKIGIDLQWRIACKCAYSSLTTHNFDAIYCSDFESNTTPFKNLPLTTVNIGNGSAYLIILYVIAADLPRLPLVPVFQLSETVCLTVVTV